jgi:hypothetical protein
MQSGAVQARCITPRPLEWPSKKGEDVLVYLPCVISRQMTTSQRECELGWPRALTL